MSVERLQKLREVLVNHQNNGLVFNMGYWSRKGYGQQYEEAFMVAPDLESSFDWYGILKSQDDVCKTYACAAGLYCHTYPDEPLKLMKRLYDDHYYEIVYKDDDFNLKEIDALAYYFGIDNEDAAYLFSVGEYPEAKVENIKIEKVIERVDKVIKRYQFA